jgi:hypothetical protein
MCGYFMAKVKPKSPRFSHYNGPSAVSTHENPEETTTPPPAGTAEMTGGTGLTCGSRVSPNFLDRLEENSRVARGKRWFLGKTFFQM